VIGRSETLALAPRVDEGEVLRYLGYPAGACPRGAVADALSALLPRATEWLRPRAVCRFDRVTHAGRTRLELEGGGSFRGAIHEFLGECRAAALFIGTVGAELERAAGDAFRRGEQVSGLVLDAIGSAAADAVAGAVEARIRLLAEERGWALTAPYSPGSCGMALQQQQEIFRLLPAGEIGVELTSSMGMRPAKSVSGLIGLGEPGAVAPYACPCERCEMTGCAMRRAG